MPQRSLAFLVVGTAVVMAVMDSAVMNIALPIIAEEHQATPSEAIWIMTAYQVAVITSLFPLASLASVIGFRTVYVAGIIVFTLASASCAIAPNLEVLSLLRVVQGLGAGALLSINGAFLRYILPASRLGRGIGAVEMIVGITVAAGPTISASIITLASWRGLFLINIPLGMFVLWGGLKLLPGVPRSGDRFDIFSAGLNALTFGFLISGLSSLAYSTHWMIVVGQLVISVVAGTLLIRRQLNRTVPLLPMDLFRIPSFTRSVFASTCSYAAQFISLIALPFYLYGILGRSELELSLILSPWPVATAIIAFLSGRLVEGISARWLCVAGMMLFAVGLGLVAVLPAEPSNLDIMIRLTLCGVGFGLFQSPNNKVMISSAPRERAGAASSTQSTARVLGQSVGAALAASLIGLSIQFNLATLMFTAAALAMIAAVGVNAKSFANVPG